MRDTGFRGILLDVDGTLYRQGPLRLLMALELCTLPFVEMSWRRTKKVLTILRKFRKIREELRRVKLPKGQKIEEVQYSETARQVGASEAAVKMVVEKWMYKKPLKYLRWCRRNGVAEFFAEMTCRGVLVGVFSDYPVSEKIAALGLTKWVKLGLCATDKEINAFKPNPRGYLLACEIWGVSPSEVLYIGDRVEVDSVGAVNAGMPCIIFDGTLNAFSALHLEHGPKTVTSFPGIQHALTTHC